MNLNDSAAVVTGGASGQGEATAFALARENRMPIIVFSILEPGAIKAVLSGTARATVVE